MIHLPSRRGYKSGTRIIVHAGYHDPHLAPCQSINARNITYTVVQESFVTSPDRVERRKSRAERGIQRRRKKEKKRIPQSRPIRVGPSSLSSQIPSAPSRNPCVVISLKLCPRKVCLSWAKPCIAWSRSIVQIPSSQIRRPISFCWFALRHRTRTSASSRSKVSQYGRGRPRARLLFAIKLGFGKAVP